MMNEIANFVTFLLLLGSGLCVRSFMLTLGFLVWGRKDFPGGRTSYGGTYENSVMHPSSNIQLHDR